MCSALSSSFLADDIFATVSGLAFDWDLNPVDSRSTQHHLVDVPFEDVRLAQEDTSKLRNAADAIMVRGVHAGQENVSVVLQEWTDFYSPVHAAGQAQALGLPSDWIVLTVAEEFSVDPPSPILLLVGSSLGLKLLTTVGRKPKGKLKWSSRIPPLPPVSLAAEPLLSLVHAQGCKKSGGSLRVLIFFYHARKEFDSILLYCRLFLWCAQRSDSLHRTTPGNQAPQR